MDGPFAVRAWLAWPANRPRSMLWFVVPPAQGALGQVPTYGRDGIVVSYGGRRREFQPCPHPVRLREPSTNRPLRIAQKPAQIAPDDVSQPLVPARLPAATTPVRLALDARPFFDIDCDGF